MKICWGYNRSTMKQPTMTINTSCSFSNTNYCVVNQSFGSEVFSQYPTTTILTVSTFRINYYNNENRNPRGCYICLGY